MEIQPRSFGDALAQVISNLGKAWRPLLGPAIISSVALGLMTIFALQVTDSFDSLDLAMNNPEALNAMSDEQLADLLIKLGQGFFLAGVVSVVVYGYLYLAASRAVGQAQLEDREISVSGAAVSLFPLWLVATILAAIGTMIGFLLLIIPGIWLAMMLSMYTPVVALERKGPVAALRRSYELVKGSFWETLGFLLLVGLIGGTASQLFQLVAIPMLMTGSNSFAFGLAFAVGMLGQGAILAAIAVGSATWYLNLRARLDGPYVLDVS